MKLKKECKVAEKQRCNCCSSLLALTSIWQNYSKSYSLFIRVHDSIKDLQIILTKIWFSLKCNLYTRYIHKWVTAAISKWTKNKVPSVFTCISFAETQTAFTSTLSSTQKHRLHLPGFSYIKHLNLKISSTLSSTQKPTISNICGNSQFEMWNWNLHCSET